MKKFLLLILVAIPFAKSSAQVTWAGQIADIVYTNCSNCHNLNGIAPFELMSYTDAVQNGNDIKDFTDSREMPPWPPDPSYSTLAHPRTLTQQQIDDIADWVDNGMPRGDSTLEPTAPVFNTVSEIANPDLVLAAPVYNVNTNNDVYRCFVVPTNLLTEMYITGFEAIPGNRNVVHHILIYSDTTSTPASLDAQDPGPGYTNFGGTGSTYSKLIGAWVPGQRAYFAPGGMGIRLPANANVILQIHYPGGISSQVDSSKVFLKLASAPLRPIDIDSPLNHYFLDNGPLYIPANTVKTFTAHYTIPIDISALSVGPHMHLIGTKVTSWGITPSNDTIPFVHIEDWDFHWQGFYQFPKVMKLPAGTTIYSTATYDNTTNNPENPNNPPHNVHLGESTTDEMMLIYFSYTPYMNGDENIIIDSAIFAGIEPVGNSIVSTIQLYDPIPNPAKDLITYQYFNPKSNAVKISVVDIDGKLIMEETHEPMAGMKTSQINVEKLSAGIYFLTLNSDGVVRTKKFLKQE